MKPIILSHICKYIFNIYRILKCVLVWWWLEKVFFQLGTFACAALVTPHSTEDHSTEAHSTEDHSTEKRSIRPKTNRPKKSPFDRNSFIPFERKWYKTTEKNDISLKRYLTLPLTLTGYCSNVWRREVYLTTLFYWLLTSFLSVEWTFFRSIGLRSNGPFFGRLVFGRMGFGRMVFGRMGRHQNFMYGVGLTLKRAGWPAGLIQCIIRNKVTRTRSRRSRMMLLQCCYNEHYLFYVKGVHCYHKQLD